VLCGGVATKWRPRAANNEGYHAPRGASLLFWRRNGRLDYPPGVCGPVAAELRLSCGPVLGRGSDLLRWRLE
jgi:hypothetical protein